MNRLTLNKFNDNVYRVVMNEDAHVGYLKFIGGVWKFKAIGYDEHGDALPGGGPLTDRHNTTFTDLDEALICATLATT